MRCGAGRSGVTWLLGLGRREACGQVLQMQLLKPASFWPFLGATWVCNTRSTCVRPVWLLHHAKRSLPGSPLGSEQAQRIALELL